MKLNNARTQIGLAEAITFRVLEFEASDIIGFVQDPTKLNRVVDCVNADRRQKVALVDGRAALADLLSTNSPTTEDGSAAEGSLKLLERTILKKDKEGNAIKWETDADFIERVEKALVAGTITTPSLTLTGSDDLKEKAVDTWLQGLANTLPGDGAAPDGQPAYILDINKATRTGGKSNLIAKWAYDAADSIIKNNSQAKWETNFTSGYTAGSGVLIDPIVHESFQQVAPNGSTPEVIEQTHQQNRKNLARAIAAARAQENEKRQAEFV